MLNRWRDLLALLTDPAKRAKVLGTIGAVLVAIGGVTVVITDNGPDHPGKPRGSVTVTIGGGAAPQSKVTLPPAAQAVADGQAQQDAAGDEDAAHSDLKDTKPPSTAIAQANAQKVPAGQPALPLHPPLAAVHTPGCQTHLVRNFSSRGGAPILIFVIHYTVSTDSGWAGVLGNVKWFDSTAAQASSNYIIDRRIGACALVVAEASKAWAQAAYNPWALSAEVTARGTEPSLVEGAGKARLLALMRRAHDVYGIPYRHGAVSGGRVTRTGFVTHLDLGALGGGHHDVSPFSIDPLIRAAAASSTPKPTAAQDRKRLTEWEAGKVSCLESARKHGRRPNTHAGHWKGHAGDHGKAIACRAPLERRRAHLKRTKHDARYRAIGRVLAA